MLGDGQAVEIGARVAIRVDGSTEIGSGHVQRCLALASALRRAGAQVRFVLRDLGASFDEQIAARGYATTLLPRPPADVLAARSVSSADWAKVPALLDAEETVSVLSEWRPDWVVVDHYGLSASWHRAVRNRLHCRLAAIDDLGDRALAAEIVIDHNLDPDHRAKYAESFETIGRILGGPRYALLSEAYRDVATYTFHDPIGSIGIFMGGVDRDNHSAMCLAACRQAGFTGPVEIVSTAANPNLDALQQAIADDPKAELTVGLPNLSSFFGRHGLQIGAGGGASWERCRVGAPAIVLKCVENQGVVVSGLRDADAAVGIDDPTPNAIAAAVRMLIADPAHRARIARHAAELVDGRGAERVALAMNPLVSLRSAAESDARPMLAWRNHPSTRAFFRDPRPIAEADHVAWWERTLASPDRALLIGQVGSTDVGVLRLDFDSDQAEVSIYLDPALTGLGLGAALLTAGQRWVIQHRPATRRLIAEIDPENTSSQRAFAAVDFSGDDKFWTWSVERCRSQS